MAEPSDSPVVTVSVPPQPSTYGWLCQNPLTSTCGTTLCSLYVGSKNYNRVTKFALGTVESAVTFAAGTARPVMGRVVDKLDRPITAVDGVVAGQLVKLSDKYPVLTREPGEIYSDSKDVVYQKLQSGQTTLSNTRAATWLGYGVDCTLSATENLVEHFLPPTKEEGEKIDEEEECEKESEGEKVKSTKSRFGRFRVRLRRRSNKKQKEDSTSITSSEESGGDDGERGDQVTPLSRATRMSNISYTVYDRSLRHLHAVQQKCRLSLEQLRASLDLLQYAQMVSTGATKQYHNAQAALKEAEDRLRRFLSRQTAEGEEGELSSWIVEEKTEDKDIAWLMGEEKKALYQRALDYAKWISERIYQTMQSVSKVTSYIYLPRRLREGADATLQQAKGVYTTLKLNNVPSELPSFVLSQVSEAVETQITYCRQLGGYIQSALKVHDEDPGSSDEEEEGGAGRHVEPASPEDS